MISLLLTLATTGQDPDPIARNVAFMSNAKGLSLEFTMTMQGVPSTARATLVIRFPDMQLFTCSWRGEELRYVHSKAGALAIRHDKREYDEGPAFSANRHPFGDFVGMAELAYPNFLLVNSLRAFDREGKRVLQGKENVNGVGCDKVFIENGPFIAPGQHTFWVDPEGKVTRWRRVLQTQEGVYDTTADFTKVETTAPNEIAFYATTLPIGYMPTSIPRPHTRTLTLGEQAVSGTWSDARRDSTVDLAKLVKGTPVAIVFTDTDCALSVAAEPYLASLRRTLKAKGCALIEFSLARQKPDVSRKDKDRQVYWDKDGRIEQAYGVPGTPYFLIADKTGMLAGGWQGYAKSMESDITKNLLGALEKKD